MERLKIGLVGIGAFGQVRKLSCRLEATRKFVLAANLAFESAGRTRPISEAYTHKRNGERRTVEHLSQSEDYLCIKNIESIVKHAGYREFKLFK